MARHLSAGVLVAVLAGCSPAPVDLSPVTPGSVTDDYDDVLDRWTRSTETYSGFQSIVSVAATYFGPEMLDAWVQEQQRAYGLDAAGVKAERAKLDEDTARTHRFFLAVFTNEATWNDLDEADPAFRLWMSSNLGPRVAPVSIERVRDRNETIRRFFPTLGHFREGYVVRFARETPAGTPTVPPGARTLALELTGPHGSARLEWEIK